MTIVQHFPKAWQDHWQASGFHEPSAIQVKSFSALKEGRSVLGISPTGTGKTLAYLWPLLLKVEKDAGTQLLVLAPSQELALQIHKVAQEWGEEIGLKAQVLIGGANVKRQMEQLKKKPEIIVGTPGRVMELIKNKKVKSHLLQTIVVDEVDQLLKEKDWNLTIQILKSAPVDYQLVFYSATGEKELAAVEALSSSIQIIDVTKEDTSAGEVTHFFMRVPDRKKSEFLRRLAYTPDFSGIVFFNQVAELGAVEERLAYEGVPIVSLASDQNKQQRKRAIDLFTQKKAQYLLTTDIAARGLDFSSVPFVINMEVPLRTENYVHRSGRVGRMGETGSVVTFINERSQKDYRQVLRKLTITAKELFVYQGDLHLEEKSTSDSKFEESKGKKKQRKNKGARKKTD